MIHAPVIFLVENKYDNSSFVKLCFLMSLNTDCLAGMHSSSSVSSTPPFWAAL